MKLAPTVPVGLKDAKLITLLTAVAKCLKLHPDHQCYNVTVIWKVPYLLEITPAGDPQPRNIKPQVVRLASCVVTNAPDTPIDFGATTWSWQGGNRVKITNQSGLVEDVKYTLTFEVVG